MKKSLLICAILCGACVYPLTASAAPNFIQLPMFPSTPAGFSTLGAAITTGQNAGRFLLWDGSTVYIERNNIASGDFKVVATGIAGDPSFVAVHPDGQRVLLGAGKCDIFGSGLMFLVDTNVDIDDPGFTTLPAPVNVTPVPINHFSGVWLNSTQVLIDACVTFGSDELILYDLAPFFASMASPIVKTVVTNKAAFSAFMSINAARTTVFAGDGGSGEAHQLSVAALINAFDTNTPIDWAVPSVDNIVLGTFSPGGPGALTSDATLIFGDFSPQVIFALPPAYTSTSAIDPSGTGLNSYTVAYNSITDEVLAIGTDFTTFPATMTGWVAMPPAVPASSPPGLIILVCALTTIVAASLWRSRKA